MSGYIKLHRKCLDSAVFGDSDLWRFWCWCLLKASYKSRQVFMNGVVVDIEPGQFIMGRKSASEELRLSQQSIRTMLKNLEKLGNLTSQSTNRFTVVTLINWEVYQDDAEISTSQSTSNQPAANQQLTSNQPAANHKQEGKEGYNVRKEEYISDITYPPVPDGTQPPSFLPVEVKTDKRPRRDLQGQERLFEVFWAAYPRHRRKSKKDALKAWLNAKQPFSDSDVDQIVQILSVQSRSHDWTKDNGDYVPLPATWIRGERWNDEIADAEVSYGFNGDW